MKQPNDDKTLDMLPGGTPVFDLDHEHPWPMPAGGKWQPRIRWDAPWEPKNWGASIVASPEYLAEQARRTTEYREALVRMELPDPAAETNPVAAAFTRLMTWSRR